MQPSLLSSVKTFYFFLNILVTPKGNSIPIKQSPPISLAPQRLQTTDPSVSTDLPILDISCKWDYMVRGLCVWLLPFSIIISSLPMLWHASLFPPLLRMTNIPLYAYTPFYVSIYLLMNIWIIYTV